MKKQKDTAVEELRVIGSMLRVATEYRLETEVVWSFSQTLKANPKQEIGEAAGYALTEWDL